MYNSSFGDLPCLEVRRPSAGTVLLIVHVETKLLATLSGAYTQHTSDGKGRRLGSSQSSHFEIDGKGERERWREPEVIKVALIIGSRTNFNEKVRAVLGFLKTILQPCASD